MQNKFSIKIIFLVLSIIGFALFPLLSIQLLPNLKAYRLSVNYTWPNAAPAVIEQAVATPLEGAFNLVSNVKKIYSISRQGQGSIQLELDKQVDLAMLRFEIATKIRQLYPKLPKGLSYPTISVQSPDDAIAKQPILTYSLGGNSSQTALYQYAKEILSPQLALEQGIEQIKVEGGNEMEWLIQYNDTLSKALAVERVEILAALQDYFRQEALGIIEDKGNHFFIRLGHFEKNEESYRTTTKSNNTAPTNSSLAKNQEALKNIIIKKTGQRLIKLGDIAHIQFVESMPQSHYRINGQNSVRLLFFPEQQVNRIQIAANIKERIAALTTNLPSTYQLYLDTDTTEYLKKELDKIKQRTVFSLGILLLFVLLIYRNFRHLGIILFSLFANLGIAFIFYYWLEVTLHLYALAGITVSFGIIIDNTLVMTHHLQHRGDLKIFPVLVAATLTTLAALIIIFFLPEIWQLNLLEFAKVIGINLGVSLLVAAFLIPALVTQKENKQTSALNLQATKRYKRHRQILYWQYIYKNLLSFLLKWRKTVGLLVLLAFGLPVFMLPNKIDGWEWYNRSLGNDWYLENVKPMVNKCLGGTLRLFVWYVYEGANYRQAEETVLSIQGSMPNGATLAQMDAVFNQLEAYLAQFPVEIKQYVTNIYNGQFAETKIYFNEGYDLSFPYQLKGRLVAFSINLGGVKWQVYGVGKGFTNANAAMPPHYRLKMQGYNKDQLNEQAARMAQKLQQHPRVRKVNTQANVDWWTKDLYEYELAFNQEKVAQKQLSLAQIRPIFTNFNQSSYPNLYTPEKKGIRLVAQSLGKNDLWLLQNQLIAVDSQQLYLSELSQIEKQKVISAIHKEDQQYIQILEWEYTGSQRFGNKHLAKCKSEMEKELPLGYTIEEAYLNFWNQKESKQYQLFLLIIGLIFFICAIQFESFSQAMVIVLLIPISYIGVFLSFYSFDFNFDQGGYTAFILLSGLVVNSLILIINDYNYYRKRFPKRSFLQNYIKAFSHKITPVLLTIISTALGLVPFLWHGEQEVFWFSLAIGTIGGLLFSIIVLFFLIPVFLIRNK